MRKQMTGKMALGAGLAFLMAVSLTGCEMDRMDQEAAETKAEDPADETETAESGDNRTGEIPEETSGPGRRQSRRRPLGRTRSQISRCLWRPGGTMTGNGRTRDAC